MSRAQILRDAEGRFYGVKIQCPGCGSSHIIPVRNLPAGETESPRIPWKDRWTWNGDLEKPTFQPSLNTWGVGENGEHEYVCHSFITNGQIAFQDDCYHALNGKTVDLPELE